MREVKLSKEEEKRMLEGLERFTEDTRWLDEQRYELFKTYPNEWVMVYNKTVVDHGKDLQCLCNRMRKEGKFDPGHCAGKFLTGKPDPPLLISIWSSSLNRGEIHRHTPKGDKRIEEIKKEAVEWTKQHFAKKESEVTSYHETDEAKEGST